MELGDEQLTEINNIQARFAEHVAALIESEFAESGGGEKLSADHFDALQKRVSHLSKESEAEGEAEVLDLLTSEQKEKLEALRGELLSSDKKK